MKTPITEIPGIGPSTAETLAAHGFASVEDIAASDIESLSKVPGFGRVKAGRAIVTAITLVPVVQPETNTKKKPTAVKKVAKKISKSESKSKPKKVKEPKAKTAKKDKKSKKAEKKNKDSKTDKLKAKSKKSGKKDKKKKGKKKKK